MDATEIIQKMAELQHEETSTSFIVSGILTLNDGRKISLKMQKSKAVPKGKGDYLPSVIKDEDGNELWNYRSGIEGRAKIFFVKGEYVIVYVKYNHEQRQEELLQLIPVVDLYTIEIMTEEGTMRIGGHSVVEIIRLKHQMAREYHFKVSLTPHETTIYGEIRKESERITSEKKQKAKEAREDKLKCILSRKEVCPFTDETKILHGIPVLAEELHLLPGKTKLIVVESYDEATGNVGKPIEAFILERERNKPGFTKKHLCKNLSWEKPSTFKKADSLGIIGQRVLTFDNETREFFVVKESALDDLKKIVNSGTKVVVEHEKHFTVHCLEKGVALKLGQIEKTA